MKAVIEVEGTTATYNGLKWVSDDADLMTFLNGYRWMGSRHSEHGMFGSHAVAVAKDIGATVISVKDTPTDIPDVVGSYADTLKFDVEAH